jgi:hypothetical protein
MHFITKTRLIIIVCVGVLVFHGWVTFRLFERVNIHEQALIQHQQGILEIINVIQEAQKALQK